MKKNEFWISRDKGRSIMAKTVEVWTEEPFKGDGYFNGGGDTRVAALCVEQFVKVTGIKMKKGDLKKVKLIEVK
jgi:hypothetical protein